jgi:SRSO17 transposase
MSKARQANPTIPFVDEYCQLYQELFPDVRSFEHFKFVHRGMLSEIKRKTLPAIARVGGDRRSPSASSLCGQCSVERRRAAQETAHFVTPGASREVIRAVH